MSEYPFKQVEKKIQQKWNDCNAFKTSTSPKKKYYALEMFSYPSGDLHVGHLRNYVIVDLIARYHNQLGEDVLHPIGWDAFGLPAEEAAIKRGADPETWTMNNIQTSRQTLKSLGIGYDWNTEIMTCDPRYYKWTQWIFLKLFEQGLAYRASSYLNWCPQCNTVLANEQVEQGKCWRCKAEVHKRELEQWFFKTTEYAQRLLEDLNKLEGKWPEPVITAQKNWIGRSEGAEVEFKLKNKNLSLTVFTTRPDTLWGVTYAAIAPDHRLVDEIIRESDLRQEVLDYVRQSLVKSDIERTSTVDEKTGVFSGVYLVHPLTGEDIPLWVCDYVLASYGTGVIMAVPAHDCRDFAFAHKYNLPIKTVITPSPEQKSQTGSDQAYTEPGIMVNSGKYSGQKSSQAIPLIIEELENRKIGRAKVNYKLHDWLVSRQRYWGAPIPIIYCDHCGIVPVEYEQLPVELPKNVSNYLPKGRSVLSDVKSFAQVKCPRCHRAARRDGDTLDTFVDSSWYQLRYPDPHNSDELISESKANQWLPVDQYVGGIEHATGHLIYFRFITKFLYDLGIIPVDEPAVRLFNQGMVCGADGSVMSKSKGNGVEAGHFVKNFGADVCRVTTLFLAPPGKDAIWTEQGVAGVKRFLDRIWRLGERVVQTRPQPRETFTEPEKKLHHLHHLTLKNVTEDLEDWGFNTAIAYMMELVNAMVPFEDDQSPVFHHCFVDLIKILAPFAPHLAEEIWERLGNDNLIMNSGWPEYDPEAVLSEQLELVIQVNGKLRGKIMIFPQMGKNEVVEEAKQHENVSNYLQQKEIVKVIYVPGKLVNFVIKI